MKAKLIAVLLGAVILTSAFAGGGKEKSSSAAAGSGEPPFVVDLSTLQVAPLGPGDVVGTPVPGIRNENPFTKNYDDLFIVLPEFPVDVTKYARLTIRAKYFNADGVEIEQGDGNAMVSVIEDITVTDSKFIRGGGAEGSYPNIPIKEYNVGGYSSTLSKDRGARIRYSKTPRGVLFQNSNTGVKFIEVTGIIFHNGDFKTEE